jgi:hypothetical protein
MKIRILSITILLILGALLFSCRMDDASQTSPDPDAVRTEAVATYASSLTETLVAQPQTSPTLEMNPTATPLIVTATIEASPTITPNPCFNLMYISDVTIPDGSPMKAGEVFTKTWQVQNIGGCAWRAGFTFRHVGGDPMRGQTVTLTEAIPTGAIRELSVQLVVPGDQTGLIQSAWRMADENGSFFGDTLTVNIVVGGTANPTATP